VRSEQSIQSHAGNAEFLRGISDAVAIAQQASSIDRRSATCRACASGTEPIPHTRRVRGRTRQSPALPTCDRAPRAVDQFAHITGPPVVGYRGERIGREAAHAPAYVLLEAVEYVLREQFDVLAARAAALRRSAARTNRDTDRLKTALPLSPFPCHREWPR